MPYAPLIAFSGDHLLLKHQALPQRDLVQHLTPTSEIKTTDWLAIECHETPLPTPYHWSPLRQALQTLSSTQQQQIYKAKSLLRWQRMHRFCGQCGHPTVRQATGWATHCKPCKTDFFPRLSPSIIVLVHDGDRLLLGRQPHFPAGMYSCLAGFIDAGETAEHAVHREVKEEANIEINPPTYYGTQPWPFPDSFMMGYFAAYHRGPLMVNDGELEDVQWFQRDALPTLPTSASIAYHLIQHYLKYGPTAMK